MCVCAHGVFKYLGIDKGEWLDEIEHLHYMYVQSVHSATLCTICTFCCSLVFYARYLMQYLYSAYLFF